MSDTSPTSDEATPVEGAAGTDASRARTADRTAGAAPDAATDDDPRATRVAAARAAWTRHLVDLGGRNTLLWYRDLPTGTLDLTTAHPGGVASMMAGRPTKLSDLVREPAALEDARRRARAIAAKSRELAEERGILTCFLAVGMATWAARLPDGRPAPRSPGRAGAAALVHAAAHRCRPGRLPARPRARARAQPGARALPALRAGHHPRRGRHRGAGHPRRHVRPLPGVRRARRRPAPTCPTSR